MAQGPYLTVRDIERAAERLYGNNQNMSSEAFLVSLELTRGLHVTELGAKHRALTIRALIAKRKRHWWQTVALEAEALLNKAACIRQEAQALVLAQEGLYRYPIELIARQRKDFTAYHFGYLYPVSDLFFWKREEEQIRNSHFHAFYMNIWNFWRIIGLGSLCN